MSLSTIGGMPTVNILKTTINGNTANNGAGIYNGGGTVNLTNSTVSDNTSTSEGGGIYQQSGTLRLIHATVAKNMSTGNQTQNLRVAGGGAFSGHSIVAYSTPSANCSGTPITTLGNNIDFPGANCGFNGPGDQTGTDPLLGSLQLNQPLPTGTTTVNTHAPAGNSPAVDGVIATPLTSPGIFDGCTTTDERGVPRPQNITANRCDVGAFELQKTLTPTPTHTSTPTVTPTPSPTNSPTLSIPPCVPRPNVGVATTLVGSGIQVVVTAGSGSVAQIQFQGATPQVPSPNALVTVGTQANQAGAFTYVPPPGTTQVTFTAQPQTPGAPITVSFVVTDGCGQFQSLAGRGA